MLLATVGCGGGGGAEETTPNVMDVRGLYDASHGGSITVELGSDSAAGSATDVLTFGAYELDMAATCAKADVYCPTEIVNASFAVNQPLYETGQSAYDPWLVNFHNISGGDSFTPNKGGKIDTDGLVLISLGTNAENTGDCGIIGSSGVALKFAVDEDGAPTGAISTGSITVRYSGGCLWPDEDALKDSEVVFRNSFTAEKTGAYNMTGAPAVDTDGTVLEVGAWDETTGCYSDEWACGDGTCVSLISECDGVEDCPGGEDEIDCESTEPDGDGDGGGGTCQEPPAAPICDPACPDGEYCAADDDCQPIPATPECTTACADGEYCAADDECQPIPAPPDCGGCTGIEMCVADGVCDPPPICDPGCDVATQYCAAENDCQDIPAIPTCEEECDEGEHCAADNDCQPVPVTPVCGCVAPEVCM